MPDRSAKRTSPDGEAAALEQPPAPSEEQIMEVADAATSDDDDASCASEPARKWRASDACGYLHSRECRSDAATTVIFIMIVVLLVEHYVHDSGLR